MPEDVVNTNGVNNISDVVLNMEQEQTMPENSYTLPEKTGPAPVESQFTMGDFTDQYLADKNANNEMNKLFDAEFPDSASTGALPNSTYYPGIDDPILKGMSSSKTLGSQPIFVRSGGFYPFGVLDARKKALEDSARVRAQQMRAFDLPKKPLTKDPRFQEELNKSFDNTVQTYINKAKTLYGDKGTWVLQNKKDDPLAMEFRQALDNYDVLARETDQVTDMISTIKQGITDKTMAYSPQTKQKVDEFERLIGDFEGGKVDVNLRKNLNELKGSQAVDIYLNKNVYPELKADINEAWGKFNTEGDLNVARSGKRTTYKNLIRKTAERLKESEFADQPWETVDTIAKRMEATLGDQFESDIRSSNKPTDRLSGYDVQSKSELNRQDERSVAVDNVSFNMKNAVDLKTAKNAKPWNVTGATYYTFELDENGEPTDKVLTRKTTGTTNFIPYTYGDSDLMGRTVPGAAGVLVTKEEIRDEVDPTKIKIIERREPVFLEEKGQEAKFRTETPVTYDFYKEKSIPSGGEIETKTIITDKQGNEKSSSTTTKKKSSGVTIDYDNLEEE